MKTADKIRVLGEALKMKSYNLHIPNYYSENRGDSKTADAFVCSICGQRPHKEDCKYGQALALLPKPCKTCKGSGYKERKLRDSENAWILCPACKPTKIEEFVKETMIFLKSKLLDYTFDDAMVLTAKYLKQACTYLTAQQEQIKGFEEDNEKRQSTSEYDEGQANADKTLRAENKRLKDLLAKRRRWRVL